MSFLNRMPHPELHRLIDGPLALDANGEPAPADPSTWVAILHPDARIEPYYGDLAAVLPSTQEMPVGNLQDLDMTDLLNQDLDASYAANAEASPLFVPTDGPEASTSGFPFPNMSTDASATDAFGSSYPVQELNYFGPTLVQQPLYNGYDYSNQVQQEPSGMYLAPPEVPQRPQQAFEQAGKRDTSSGSSPSSTDSSDDSCQKRKRKTASRFTAQKPQFDPRRPWVRTNALTEGKTTRSGKLNEYDPSVFYKTVDPPIGTWRGPNYKFKYDKFGGLYKSGYTIEELQEFLYHHPGTGKNKLVLWIQRTGADSARRYPTPHFSKCRFADCPSRKLGYHGNIQVGHYRVAFDEKWNLHGQATDPYFTAGYVHLYCLERFMDFADICDKFDVRVDERHMTNEPNHEFASALHGAERSAAQRFLEARKTGFAEHFRRYHIRASSSSGDNDVHKHSLTYAMNVANNKSRPATQQKELAARKLRGSQIIVHKGDLQMCCEARAEARRPKNFKGVQIVEDDNEDDDSEVEVAQPARKKRKSTLSPPTSPQSPRRSPRNHSSRDASPVESTLGKRQRTDDAQLQSAILNYITAGPTVSKAVTKARPPPISVAGDHLYRPNKKARISPPPAVEIEPVEVPPSISTAFNAFADTLEADNNVPVPSVEGMDNVSEPVETSYLSPSLNAAFDELMEADHNVSVPDDFDYSRFDSPRTTPENLLGPVKTPPRERPASRGRSQASPTLSEGLRRSPRLASRSVSPTAVPTDVPTEVESPPLRRSPRNHSPTPRDVSPDGLDDLFEGQTFDESFGESDEEAIEKAFEAVIGK